MNKTIFRSVLLACCIVMMFSLAVTLFFLNSYFIDIEFENLRAQAEFTAQAVDKVGLDYFESFSSDIYRITWIEADGDVIFDSDADETAMENHLDRDEIREALAYGHGQDRRLSDTLSRETLYSAVRISDGSVVRLSVTQASVLRITLGVIPYMLAVLVLALVLCAFISRRISRRIIDPLNRLDLDRPLENETYEELSPLLVRIDNQNRQIEKQIDTIRMRQKEFNAITDNMREGMIILNKADLVVSMNTSAMKLFGGSPSVIGKNILVLDRSVELMNALGEVEEKGRSEYNFERNGFVNRLIANRIRDDNGKVLGTCILIVDETEKVLAEGMRKEFSANVSHELKTPLHSILASSELLINNLVKEGDKMTFIERIHSEAEHLLTLIEDIIRLSQLDETREFPREEVSFREIVDSVVDALGKSAADRNVTMTSDVEDIRILGVRRLVYEIAFNLADNAILYNREGGHVDIGVHETGDGIVLAVRDDGIGIPKEHQARIFERFYRVDTSHSRSTGGTGLGLSIVKHAAMVMNAVVALDSSEGGGSTFSVTFPLSSRC